MNKKILAIIFGIFLMVGVVSADRSLSNVVNFTMPANVVAGSSFDAEFSFDYRIGGDNVDGSPLIINLSIVSDDEERYPVVKGDFVISGVVKKSWFFNMLTKTVEFDCSEEYEQTIEHPLDAQNVTAPDGVFYCYNEEGDLKLEESDDVTLNIVSHHALYPGKYSFSASMFYLTDERAPFIEITNRNVFKKYYTVGSSITVDALISDPSGLKENGYGAIVFGEGVELFRFNGHTKDGGYYFPWSVDSNIEEGDYDLMIFAEDVYNNSGNDSVSLKIDRTAPNITLVEPDGVVGEIFSIVANVTDEKSGVDNESVLYKLKAQGCDDGSNVPDCYNSGWLPLAYIDEGVYGIIDINATAIGLSSGSYNLQIKASDILGNEGALE